MSRSYRSQHFDHYTACLIFKSDDGSCDLMVILVHFHSLQSVVTKTLKSLKSECSFVMTCKVKNEFPLGISNDLP